MKQVEYNNKDLISTIILHTNHQNIPSKGRDHQCGLESQVPLQSVSNKQRKPIQIETKREWPETMQTATLCTDETDSQQPYQKPETAVSMSHKEDFRSETIEDREEPYRKMEMLIFKEDIIILNVYSSNKRGA